MIRRAALAAAILAPLFAAGCDETDPGAGDPPAVEAATPADKRIGDAIDAALDAADSPVDTRLLPPRQLAEIGPILDNLAEIYARTDAIAVSDGEVVVRTSLEPSDESDVTAQLICGAVVDSGAEPGAVVLGVGPEGDEELRTCRRADRRYP